MKKDIKMPDYLFEVSWEVCNKVGGIYEVVASKAQHAMRAFDGEYFLLGPDTRPMPYQRVHIESESMLEWRRRVLAPLTVPPLAVTDEGKNRLAAKRAQRRKVSPHQSRST